MGLFANESLETAWKLGASADVDAGPVLFSRATIWVAANSDGGLTAPMVVSSLAMINLSTLSWSGLILTCDGEDEDISKNDG